MSHEDFVRRLAESTITNNPHAQNLKPEEMPNYQDRQTYNNELDRIRSDLLVQSDKKQGSF